MPQCKALKTFHSDRYGMLRSGSRFSSEQGYAVELASRGLIEILPDPLRPERHQAFDSAPLNKGKLPPDPPPQKSTADPPDAGAGKPSVLSRVGQALQRPTAPSSKPANAKRS